MSLNAISDRWLSTFLETRNPQQTEIEARFVQAIVEPGSRILDLACGYGRHAAVLSSLSFQVVGVDRDPRMLSRARQFCTVVQSDMRCLPFRSNTFDAATILWQSFGYFGSGENLAVLSDLLRIVRPGGILILDLYNLEHFETRPRQREFVRAGTRVQETVSLKSERLRINLDYDGGVESDEFDWQVYSPRTLQDLATAAGWTMISAHRDFDPAKRPDPASLLIQYVLRRPTA